MLVFARCFHGDRKARVIKHVFYILCLLRSLSRFNSWLVGSSLWCAKAHLCCWPMKYIRGISSEYIKEIIVINLSRWYLQMSINDSCAIFQLDFILYEYEGYTSSTWNAFYSHFRILWFMKIIFNLYLF